jgi:DNA-binding response OmpR family regulator
VLSSSQAEFDRKLALQHNASNYLVKPFDNAEFEAMISELTDFWTQWKPDGGDAER